MLSFSKMEINIVVRRGYGRVIGKNWLEKLARKILIAAGVDASCELSLLITGQDEICRIHRKWLGEDTPTDVISFPMLEHTRSPANFKGPPDGILHLGEVIISYPQAVIQARHQKHPVRKEIAVLLIHGVLHLLGHDHDIPGRKRKMQTREAVILKSIEEKYP